MFHELFTYDDCEESSDEMIGFSGIVMLKDFGPLKAGDKLDNIWFLLDSACCACYDAGGHEIHKFTIKLEAV